MTSKSSKLLSKLFNLKHLRTSKDASLSNLISAADYFGINYKGTHNFEGIYKDKNSLSLNTQFIHITGTNGKGSVTNKISKAIELSGIRTGKYTSPHISSVIERITINSQAISKERFENDLEEILFLIENERFDLSYFDTLTLLMLRYFHKEKVEVAVIEVGCGGLLDSTNIINPLLSIVTSIGIDHPHLIGRTREEIATNKSGIFKKNTAALVGFDCFDKEIFIKKAEKLNSDLYFVDSQGRLYEEENKLTARKALILLRSLYDEYIFKGRLTDKVIEEGVESRESCRFEDVIKVNGYQSIEGYITSRSRSRSQRKVNDEKIKNIKEMISEDRLKIILDVAHNLHAIEKVIHMINTLYKGYYIRVIIGISSNKDVIDIFKKVISNADRLYFVTSENERLLTVEDLQAYVHYLNEEYVNVVDLTDENVVSKENIGEVKEIIYKSIEDLSYEKELILICGSFFIMKDARLALGYKDYVDELRIDDK